MSDSTFDHLKANVEAAVDFVDTLETLLGVDTLDNLDDEDRETVAGILEDHGIDFDAQDGYAIELVDMLLEYDVLELYGNARVTADSVDVREVVAVTGVGGPHIEFGIDFNGRVVARGFWSSDKVERVTYAPALGEYLIESIGGWDR